MPGMADRPKFTIFYAWQSDSPRSHNRDLIQAALDQVCKELNADPKRRYQIEVTSDTRGVPGLCDIPAEILNKIERADAAVLDLTFVASMDANNKRCPNPNVLFELGYAFHAIGPSRLICVMNEALGAPADTMFDIAHRRWPIRYTSPADGLTKKAVIAALADSLKGAIELIVELGPQSTADSAGESERQFEVENAEIRANWESSVQGHRGPTMYFSLRPLHFEKRRYPNADELEKLLRRYQVVDLLRQHHDYPPAQRGTDVMPWGLFNGLYGRPAWSLCYSGQFWAAVRIGANSPYQLTDRDKSIYAYDRVASRTFEPGQWIDYMYARIDMADVFKFAGSFAKAFPPGEQLAWSVTVEGIKETILASSSQRIPLCSRLCGSPMAYTNGVVQAGEFAERWEEICVDLLAELFGMFDICGDRISRDTLEKFLANKLDGRE
jgi:hypothetical protein